MIKVIRKQIDLSLVRFFKKVQREYKLHLIHPVLFESIREFALREGKRIRPMLFILSYKGYCKKTKNIPSSIYDTSLCIELLHDFMLVHDDIIDSSDLRRGKPTLHKKLSRIIKTDQPQKLGESLGIIAGDIIYSLAIDSFLSVKASPNRKDKALKYFVQTAAFTAMGEFIDTLNGIKKVQKVSEEDVFLNYTLKTARYTFDCPLVIGALLAGAKDKEIKQLSALGIMIGQAFQIQDDIIGIFETQKNIGKSILSDLAESKKTILVAHAYKHLPQAKRKQFLKVFLKPKKTYQDLVTVRKIFLEAGSLKYSLQQIKSRLKKAQKTLDHLKMNGTYRDLIKESLFLLFKHSTKIAKANGIKY